MILYSQGVYTYPFSLTSYQHLPPPLPSTPRAPLLIPCTHWIAQYMLYDNYAMYQSAYYRKNLLNYSKFTDRLIVFVKKKWSMILHHALLLIFGYILVVVC